MCTFTVKTNLLYFLYFFDFSHLGHTKSHYIIVQKYMYFKNHANKRLFYCCIHAYIHIIKYKF